ncbi:MAG: 16S rRNA (adenine(1518)-N(6)/adenine(1519)-N(6))-dimethyltransferase RsmA [Betaproteobacteria bacterium]|nr:MAG: 16S rRNA (adenine(1518)-N(6)/adenine(1519)-N(6))-dimethyltransferase RsmA [Betaproteobacteria bacterium]
MRHRARRRFSQNFLIDRVCIDRIVGSVAPTRGDHIVEIGPGLGALTEPLLDAVGHMDAIEVDRDAARMLEERFAGQSLSVHCVDFLEFDLASLGSDLRLVGNLPYHISTPILFTVNQSRDFIKDCHFMLQREVVDRMVAAPASADYGRLSVMLQCRWSIEKLFDVPPTSFRPQPKVWSSVVRMLPEQTIAISDAGVFHRIVEAAFSKRRKTLRNALRGLVSEEDFETCSIDPGRRGETLSVADFAGLANQLSRRITASSE